ncbi:MAG TPA: biosynthetic-type acetolactate synthase large subunit [Bryobacteraceae bacterium]|jgi:acetolactate synthase-1/2/3 large subunit|nr:biosynthetic-type acetolactate synthase large subunit [Bryobacteraceae bacterium]
MNESGKLMNGAEVLLECLAREGVDCFFGYPGGVTLPFYDALYDSHIRHVLVRHEENACFAAEGYARATGKVGVCCATSGPGATNLVTGLVDAMMDSIPIVAITGQVHSKLIGSDAFQEADTFGITRSATKHNFMVKNVQELPQIVHEAFYIAASGRPGPVLVDIPKDVFQARGHYTPVESIHLPGYKVFTEGHAGQIRRAAQLIWEAERPMVYAGGGTVLGKATEELAELVELADLPAVCTLMALGGLSSSHKNFISMPGMHGSYAANMGMTECDLLIALGTRFDDRVTGQLSAFARHARVIHVDIDPAEVGKNRVPDIPIVGDVKRVLQKLNKALKELEAEFRPKQSAARAQWWSRIRDWQAEHPYDRSRAENEIKPQHLMDEIDRLSGGQAIVTSDVGQHQMWAAQLIRFNEPHLWINSGGLGAMGFGLPSALGAQMARPDKLVFAICGDGGFQMSIPELATIASHALPIKIIVMNNGYLGMVRQWQTLFYNNRLCSVDLDCFPDAEKLAGAYGFKGRTIDQPWQLSQALEEAVREPGPYLLNVKVTRDENVYPMVPAGGAIHEMVLGPPQPVEAIQ